MNNRSTTCLSAHETKPSTPTSSAIKVQLQTTKTQSCFMSVFTTFLHIVCITVGTGIFALPQVISIGGWLSILVLAGVAAICYYTGSLMIDCLYANPKKRLSNLSEIADYAFGKKGKMLSHAAVYSDILGVVWIYIILSVENFEALLRYFQKSVSPNLLYPMVGFIVLVPYLAFKTIKESTILSFLGFLTTAIATVVVLVFSVIGISGNSSTPQSTPTVVPLFSLSKFLEVFASFSFAFGGAVVFPAAEATMTHQSKFKLSLFLSVLFIFLAYLITSVLSIFAFKHTKIEDLIYKNLEANSVLKQLSLAAMTFHYLAATPIYLSIISCDMEDSIRKAFSLGVENEFLQRAIFRISLVGLLTSLSYFTNKFKFASGFVGSFASCLIIFIIPAACSLKLFCSRKNLKEFGYTKLAAIFFILICGAICFLGGMYSTISGMIEDNKKSN